MKIFTIGFLLGIAGIACYDAPIAWFVEMMSLVIALAVLLVYWRWPWRGFLLLFGLCLGIFWMALHLNLQFDRQFPANLFQQPVSLQGRVVSIPQKRWGALGFEFQTSMINGQFKNRLLKLNWYRDRKLDFSGEKNLSKQFRKIPLLHLGDQWRFIVKLKQPKNKTNREGFNYGEWLFAHHISATGHVLSNKSYQLLHRNRWYHPVDQIRHYLTLKMNQSLHYQPLSDLLIALSVGDRTEMTPAQWQVLQRTGTAHLVAIAGLHIGLVAGLMFFLISIIWRFSSHLMLWAPNIVAASIAAWLAALSYSALAGFSLPTQRAMIMLSCFSVALIFRRVLAPWQAYFTALFFVLLLEPFQVFGISFWMSFVVVGFIVFSLKNKKHSHKLWVLIRLQFIVALAVIPLTLYFFHQVAWLSALLNIVAIPWVGFIVIPLSLLGCLFVACLPSISHALWWFALKNLQWVWHFLTYFSHLKMSACQYHITLLQFLSLLLLVLCLLSGKKWPIKLCSLIGAGILFVCG